VGVLHREHHPQLQPRRNITNDLAPPQHISSLSDYINDFTAYALRIDITSGQHQVSLFINSLQHALREVVVHYHPRLMETTVSLARTLEMPTPVPAKTGRSTYEGSTHPNNTPRDNISNPNPRSAKEPLHRSSPSPATSTDTPMSPPSPDTSTRVAARIELDPEILAQLRLATLDERELQIISTTIEVQAAAPAWSLQHGIVRYNKRYYVPVTSPLLQDLLEMLRTTGPHLLAIDLHTATSSPTMQASPRVCYSSRLGPNAYSHRPRSSSSTTTASSSSPSRTSTSVGSPPTVPR
jgi:hypothetical protein